MKKKLTFIWIILSFQPKKYCQNKCRWIAEMNFILSSINFTSESQMQKSKTKPLRKERSYLNHFLHHAENT